MCFQYTFYHLCGHIQGKSTFHCDTIVNGRLEGKIQTRQLVSTCFDGTQLGKILPTLCENCNTFCEISQWLSREPHARFALLQDRKRSNLLQNEPTYTVSNEHMEDELESRHSLSSSTSTLFDIDEDSLIRQAETFSPIYKFGICEDQSSLAPINSHSFTMCHERYTSIYKQKEVDVEGDISSDDVVNMQLQAHLHSDREDGASATQSIKMRMDRLKSRIGKLRDQSE